MAMGSTPSSSMRTPRHTTKASRTEHDISTPSTPARNSFPSSPSTWRLAMGNWMTSAAKRVASPADKRPENSPRPRDTHRKQPGGHSTHSLSTEPAVQKHSVGSNPADKHRLMSIEPNTQNQSMSIEPTHQARSMSIKHTKEIHSPGSASPPLRKHRQPASLAHGSEPSDGYANNATDSPSKDPDEPLSGKTRTIKSRAEQLPPRSHSSTLNQTLAPASAALRSLRSRASRSRLHAGKSAVSSLSAIETPDDEAVMHHRHIPTTTPQNENSGSTNVPARFKGQAKQIEDKKGGNARPRRATGGNAPLLRRSTQAAPLAGSEMSNEPGLNEQRVPGDISKNARNFSKPTRTSALRASLSRSNQMPARISTATSPLGIDALHVHQQGAMHAISDTSTLHVQLPVPAGPAASQPYRYPSLRRRASRSSPLGPSKRMLQRQPNPETTVEEIEATTLAFSRKPLPPTPTNHQVALSMAGVSAHDAHSPSHAGETGSRPSRRLGTSTRSRLRTEAARFDAKVPTDQSTCNKTTSEMLWRTMPSPDEDSDESSPTELGGQPCRWDSNMASTKRTFSLKRLSQAAPAYGPMLRIYGSAERLIMGSVTPSDPPLRPVAPKAKNLLGLSRAESVMSSSSDTKSSSTGRSPPAGKLPPAGKSASAGKSPSPAGGTSDPERERKSFLPRSLSQRSRSLGDTSLERKVATRLGEPLRRHRTVSERLLRRGSSSGRPIAMISLDVDDIFAPQGPNSRHPRAQDCSTEHAAQNLPAPLRAHPVEAQDLARCSALSSGSSATSATMQDFDTAHSAVVVPEIEITSGPLELKAAQDLGHSDRISNSISCSNGDSPEQSSQPIQSHLRNTAGFNEVIPRARSVSRQNRQAKTKAIRIEDDLETGCLLTELHRPERSSSLGQGKHFKLGAISDETAAKLPLYPSNEATSPPASPPRIKKMQSYSCLKAAAQPESNQSSQTDLSEVHPAHRPGSALQHCDLEASTSPASSTRAVSLLDLNLDTPVTPARDTATALETRAAAALAESLLQSALAAPEGPLRHRLLEIGEIMVDALGQVRASARALEEARQAARRAQVSHLLCIKSVSEVTSRIGAWRVETGVA